MRHLFFARRYYKHTGSLGTSALVCCISAVLAIAGASFLWDFDNEALVLNLTQLFPSHGILTSYLFSLTAVTPLKSSMAFIVTLDQRMKRITVIVLRDKGNEYHWFDSANLPHLPVKSIVCMSILLVFLEQAFHVTAAPSAQMFVTVMKIASLSTIIVVIYCFYYLGQCAWCF